MFCATGAGRSIEIATSLDGLGMTGRSSQLQIEVGTRDTAG